MTYTMSPSRAGVICEILAMASDAKVGEVFVDDAPLSMEFDVLRLQPIAVLDVLKVRLLEIEAEHDEQHRVDSFKNQPGYDC